MSDPSGNSSRAWRNHSLIRRLTRLRITELPTRLLTVTPNLRRFSSDCLIAPPVLGAITTTKPFEVRRFPAFTARVKSRVHKIRSARSKRPVRENTDLLRRNTCCEALSAFGAASLENCAPGTRFGSRAKSMDSFSADTAGLIGTFHRRPSIFVLSRISEVAVGFSS